MRKIYLQTLISVMVLCCATALPVQGKTFKAAKQKPTTAITDLSSLTTGYYLFQNNGRGGYINEDPNEQNLLLSDLPAEINSFDGSKYVFYIDVTEKTADNVSATVRTASEAYIPHLSNSTAAHATGEAAVFNFTLSATTGCFSIQDTGGSNFYFNGNPATFTGWSAAGGNSDYKLYKIAETDLTDITVYQINLNLTYDNQTIKTITRWGTTGSTLSQDIIPSYNYTTHNGTENITFDSDKTITIAYTLTDDFPFQITALNEDGSFKSPVWYKMTLRESKYMRYNPQLAGGNYPLNPNAAETNALEYLWCLSGNPIIGFQLYNAVTGPTQTLQDQGTNSEGKTILNMAEGTYYFDLVPNAQKTGGFALKTSGSANNYINDSGGTLATWNTTYALNSGDLGSMIQVSQAITLEEAQQYAAASATALPVDGYIGHGCMTAEEIGETAKGLTLTNLHTILTKATLMPQSGKFYAIESNFAFSDGQTKALYESYDDGAYVGWKTLEKDNVAMLWQLTPTTEGKYIISSPNSQKAMTGVRFGTPVQMTDVQGSYGAYTLYPRDMKNGIFELRNVWGDYATMTAYNKIENTGNPATADQTEGPCIKSWKDDASPIFWKIREVEEITVTIGEGGYSTRNFPFAVDLTTAKGDGLKVYTVASVSNDIVMLSEFKGHLLAANTPVILQGQEGTTFTLAISADEGERPTDNSLQGTLGAQAITGQAYVMATKDGHTGFYRLDSSDNTVPANRAYLPTVPGNNISSFNLGLVKPTGINNVWSDNGNDNVFYTIDGILVKNPQKGIYINGKGQKVLINRNK